MGVAVFIVSEREIEGLDMFVNGKGFGRASDKAVDKVCAAAGVKSLFDYVSQNPDEIRELLEDAEQEVPDNLPDEQWFDAAEGIKWAEVLAAYLNANPKSIKNSAALLEDLQEYQTVFRALHSREVRWHFAVDF